MRMSDNKQKAIIHQLIALLSIDKDTYKEMLYSHYQVESSKDLTYKQATNFISLLKKKAVDAGIWEYKKSFNKYKHNDLQNREGMATPAQLRKIEAMWCEISRQTTDTARQEALKKLIKRITKVDDIKFLTHKHVEKLIKMLNQMKRQKEEKQ